MKSTNLSTSDTRFLRESKSRPKRPKTPDLLLRGIVLQVLAFLVLAGVLYRGFGIDLLAHLPPVSFCLFKSLTGIPCPGCGMFRALVSLAQFKFVAAFSYHPFSFMVVAGMVGVFLPGSITRPFSRPKALIFLLLALIIYWIVRLWLPEFLPFVVFSV